MSIFVIADLHLSFSENVKKPMDIFGSEWLNHAGNVKGHWERMVSDSDTVIIPGDISWALKFEDAACDLNWIRDLPGRKILIRGNHDLWWVSINKLNSMFGPEMNFVQNNFFEAEGRAVCGSRGWICPGHEDYTAQDEKIYSRELLRLRSSLASAKSAGFSDITGVLHYPPTNDKSNRSGFTDLFEEFGVSHVFYGHLHGADVFASGLQGEVRGVKYKLTSLDYLKCKPFKMEVQK